MPLVDADLAPRLAAIEADLAEVSVALTRLDAGTYWTCEATGRPLSDEVLAADPTARRWPVDVADDGAAPSTQA